MSARRLGWAVAPTGLDQGALLEGLAGSGGEGARTRLARALETAPRATWERGLVEATAEPDERIRAARIHEQLTELEVMSGRWGSVPRVAVRLATSVGFLCATVALLDGLSLATSDTFTEDLHSALMHAVGAVAAGIAGASFCAAVHFRARKACAASARAADALVVALVS